MVQLKVESRVMERNRTTNQALAILSTTLFFYRLTGFEIHIVFLIFYFSYLFLRDDVLLMLITSSCKLKFLNLGLCDAYDYLVVIVFFPPFPQLLASKLGCEPDDICDFELQACDTQPSVIAGAAKEFIFSGRLDNLCMSFCSLKV